ncbi:hypothetical protein HYH03_000408 [Edaphochlamys debaryana]|uniref:Cytidyltransferase-like domain-containing protein n=1 Tax=Edaphochlamys debaryana TaxID=47281 RepID=A0A836C6H2_9CHLO|nr:hypothetical protein HYH03_000408 [Edaphochlamys debaryana]|eukprot:KAG2501910.1 hypothetical protein HYH03_000408 [Edaphochlamys debaryana]
MRCHAPVASVASTARPQELAPEVESLIHSIHANKSKAVVYATGGAVQSISWLLSVPGASATVLEACVPYSRDSLVDILGKEPEQYCSAATAGAMAAAAYRRAATLSPFGSSVVGVAATCSLATVPLKRGEHRAYVAVHSGGGSRCVGLTLAKGARSRVGEDDLVSRLLVKLLAEATGCDASAFPLPLLPPPAAATPAASPAPAASAAPYDLVTDECRAAGDPLRRLLAGEVRCVEYCGQEVTVDAPRKGRVYLPGSFNPLHIGHRKLLQAAVAAVRKEEGDHIEGAFEITIENPDKGLLEEGEVRRRVAQFVDLGLPVVVTRCPLFTLKAGLLPRSYFVVGYDTAVRLVLPKYYKDSYTQMLLDFEGLRQAGCSFVVAGRKDAASGSFLSLADVDMPPELADLFPPSLALSEESFRLDISSTELRQRQQR